MRWFCTIVLLTSTAVGCHLLFPYDKAVESDDTSGADGRAPPRDSATPPSDGPISAGDGSRGADSIPLDGALLADAEVGGCELTVPANVVISAGGGHGGGDAEHRERRVLPRRSG